MARNKKRPAVVKKIVGWSALAGLAALGARVAHKTTQVPSARMPEAAPGMTPPAPDTPATPGMQPPAPAPAPAPAVTSTSTATPADAAMLDRLIAMMRTPTVTGYDSPQQPFDDFEHYLETAYPLITQRLSRERPRNRRALLYTWRGTDDTLDPLVLLAHYDVVTPGDASNWEHDPFDPYVDDDNVLHGRGSLDDKGCLIIILEAIEELLAEGFEPHRTVYVALGGNEETVGADGPNPTPELLKERGITPWMVLDEGGAVIDAPIPGIDKRLAVVGVSEKGSLTLQMTATTPGGHASSPSPDSAIFVLAKALDKLSHNTFPRTVPAPMQEMLASLAPYAPLPLRAGLANLDILRTPLAHAMSLAGGELAASTHTTVAATMLAGGTAPNALPTEASATLNIRIAVGETIESTLAHLRRQVNDNRVSFEIMEGDDPSPISPTDNDQFATLRQAIAGSWPDALTVPYVMLACSDARLWHKHWPNVYRFCPMYMSAAQRGTIHGFNENLNVAELSRGKAFHRALLEIVVCA